MSALGILSLTILQQHLMCQRFRQVPGQRVQVGSRSPYGYTVELDG